MTCSYMNLCIEMEDQSHKDVLLQVMFSFHYTFSVAHKVRTKGTENKHKMKQKALAVFRMILSVTILLSSC